MPVSPVVTTVPVVAGNVIVVFPAIAGVTKFTEPEVAPEISIPLEPTARDPDTVKISVFGLYESSPSVNTCSLAVVVLFEFTKVREKLASTSLFVVSTVSPAPDSTKERVSEP